MAHILIVDDASENRHLLESILRSHGHSTGSARNGVEALQLAQDQDFHLILSDILMPVMDGFSLCHAWKQDPRLAPIPFAFYTATYTEPKDQQFALNLGADRFLFKPLTTEAILREVADLLEHGSGRLAAMPAPPAVANFHCQHAKALFTKLEKKHADNQRLQADNARFGQILAASQHEIFLFSGDHLRFSFVNAGALEHLGYPAEAMASLTPLDLCPDLDAPGFQAMLDTLGDGGQDQLLLETTFLRKSGARYPVQLHLEPLLDGGELSFLAIAQDISERRRQEFALRRLENELHHSQKLESLGRMASGLAHDLNNLLTPMLLAVSLLQEGHGDDAPLQKSLGTLLDTAEQARALVAGLTEYAHKGIGATQELDLNALVRQGLELLLPASPEGILWELDLAQALPAIQGDPLALARVLRNLCGNAMDAMPAGGTLKLSTRSREPGWVELTVADSGPGIPQELLARILEPFFTTKEPGKGTGLGLAIVDTIIRAHGGRLEIHSRPGAGARIQVSLPA